MPVNKQLCRLDDIPDGGAIVCEISPENDSTATAYADSIILLRQNAQVFAYRNACPHAGRRLDWAPGRFLIEEGSLICAAHGAMFTIASGECTSGPCQGMNLSPLSIDVVDQHVLLMDAAG